MLSIGHLTGEIAEEKWGSRWFIALAYAVFFSGLIVSALDSAATGSGRFTLTAVGSLGVAFFVIGLSIYFAARWTLGRFFSETVRIKPEQKLVTKGPYRIVRHPIYLGEIFYFISIPMILGSLYGFIIMLALIPLLLRRIEYEEKVLSARFGQEYEDYARKTKKLIPFIY